MAVDSTERRVVYAGNGKTTAFPFVFKVFADTDVSVQVGKPDGSEATVELKANSDYTVTLNADQNTTPGGTVNVKTAPDEGYNLAVVSAVPYTQPMVLTPYGGFNPETLNDNSDRQCIQIQQLVEQVSRAITTDPTDSMTPQELKQKLLDAAETATVIAKGYAEAAKKSEEKTAEYAEAATVIKPYADQIAKTADAIESVKAVGDSLESVKAVSQEIKTVKAVGEGMDDVRKVAQLQPHIDDIKATGEHVDELHKVGQDLQGVEASDFDCGEIGDPIDPIVTVEGGYIKKVAEHIDDCIHPVGDSLEDIKKVASNLDAVNETAELARIDYEKVFKEGL